MRLRRDAVFVLSASLVVVGIALALAHGGHHPFHDNWFLAGLVCLLLGFGIPAMMLAERPAIDPAHETRLRMMLGASRAAIESARICTFAQPPADNGQGGSDDFRKHFRPVARRAEPWNAAVAAYLTATDSLRVRFERAVEERSLDTSPYRGWVVARELHTITSVRAAIGALGRPLETDPRKEGTIWRYFVVENPPADGLHLNNSHDWAVDMTGIPEGDEYNSFADERMAPVNDLLREAQSWPEARGAQALRSAVEAFDTKPLLSLIAGAESRAPLSYARRCSTCGGQP